MRVPPDQSLTARDTAAIAASGFGDRSSMVTRVRRVAKRNASTSRVPRASACAKSSSVRV